MNKYMFHVSICFLFIAASLIHSCSDAKNLYEKFSGKKAKIDEDDYVPVPGTNATDFLSKTLSDSTIDAASQLSAIDLAINDQAKTNLIAMGLMLDGSQTAQTTTADTYNVLAGGEKNKTALEPNNFQKLSDSFLSKAASLALATDYTGDTVSWGAKTDTSFSIPALERMPVRNQGQRGTCASFAGIGLIEALIIQANPTALPFKEVDLSEQRFYYLSKPESWGDGGSTSQQGSDSGDGFMTSNGSLSGHSGPTDTGSNSYNIPLESDCKYVSSVGSNDLQIPQSDSCKTKGVVKVSKFTAWAGSQGTANKIERAQDIYNELRLNKAVIVYTKLSSNWEKNDGIITYKGAGSTGATSDAAGHAYLVVGAKKLDESAFPGEGGMCFIIRNSWGTGWGAKGLSCMTLTWYNRWRFPGPLPTVDEVQLISDAKTQITAASLRPTNLIEPDPATKQNRKGGVVVKRKGRVVVSLAPDPIAFSLATPWHPAVSARDAMDEIDGNHLTADTMNYGKLVADNDQAYKMMYTVSSDQLIVRGILDGDSKQTNNLELMRSDSVLYLNIQGRGLVTVGDFIEGTAADGTTAVATICGKQYASVCDLHYIPESNELVVGLSEIEGKRQIPQPPYDWQTLQVAGYGFQISKPESSLTKFDLRLMKDGTASNPQRLKLDPTSGAISHKGKAVGNLTQGALCSGSYNDTCKVVNTGDKFEIFPKSK